MKTKIENYKRRELFDHYDNFSNPFVSVTTKLDITNIYDFSKKNGHFYAMMGYCLTKVLSEIDEFHFTYEDGNFYKSDRIIPYYTELKSDETIGFFSVPLKDSCEEFLIAYDEAKKNFFEGIVETYQDDAEVWLSCAPWFKVTSICPPNDRNTRIPQLIWDKYIQEGDRYYVNLMIFFHHGFADGYHIGKFLSIFNDMTAALNRD